MTSTSWRMVVVFFALSAWAAERAFACSCIRPGPPCQATWTADAVFAGTVISIDRVDQSDEFGARSVLVRFNVDRVFVGAVARSVEMPGNAMNTCSYRFEAGKKYLVYATRDEGGRLSAGSCSRTRLLADAAEDLAYLRSLPAAGTSGRVYGRITELKRHPAETVWVDHGPLEHVTVSLRGATFVRGVATDAQGRFEFGDVPVGRATLTVVPPFGSGKAFPERETDRTDLRACSHADFTIAHTASASGTVVDGSGRPLAGVVVDAVAAELAGFEPAAFQEAAKTDARGVFEFNDLPSGSSVFGVNLTKRPANAQGGTPIFLPGTRLAGEATVVDLETGDRKDAGVLRLPGR